MTRRYLIGFSLLAHLGIGITAFVSGIWKLERLDAPRGTFALAVMTPPAPPPEGGHAAGPAPALEPKKKPKKIAKNTQPPPVPPEPTATTATTTAATSTAADGEGEGEGDGEGRGRGPGIADGAPCTFDCPEVAAAVCGDRAVGGREQCDDGNQVGGDGCSATCLVEPPKTTFLAPSMLGALRIAGETQIVPPDTVKTAMLRDGRERTAGTIKVCIDASGRVSSVTMAASTKYPAYDAALVGSARGWRYRPHTVNGTPTPACGMVTFVYTMR